MIFLFESEIPLVMAQKYRKDVMIQNEQLHWVSPIPDLLIFAKMESVNTTEVIQIRQGI
jgi:hypothetical protein